MRASSQTCGVLLGALAACSALDPDPPEVFDTSGARFAWVCDEHCIPKIIDGTPPLPPCNVGTPVYAWGFNRFIEIAAGCTSPGGGWGSTGNRERPLACVDTFDCPQFTNADFECRNGICQNTDTVTFPLEPITWSQAFTLCYGPIPRAATIDPLSDVSIMVSDWIEQACPKTGAPCAQALPDACLRP